MSVLHVIRVLSLSAVVTVSSFLIVGTAQAEGLAQPLPPQPLASALESFAKQMGVQLVYGPEMARGVESPGASAGLSAQETLKELLRGTGLTFEFVNEHTVTIVPADLAQSGNSRRTAEASAPGTAIRLAQGEAAATNPPTPADAASEEALELEEVVVTGTHIRGAASASPLHVYDRETIERSGYPTVQQFIRSLPQNFGGGASDLAAAALVDQSTDNIAGDNAPNLRGLGPGATLTLINGRRMPAASTGAYTDISLIPMSAVERIEIVTDGASALYGSDAVAGVINFILRDNFEGAETLVDYGRVTDGDYSSTRLSQLLGHAWDGGNLLVTYDHVEQSNLVGGDRSFAPPATANRDLVPGTNRNGATLAFNQSLASSLKLRSFGLFSDSKTRATSVLDSISDNAAQDVYAAAGLDYRISQSWSVELDADWGRYRISQLGLFGGAVGIDALTRTRSSSIDALLRGDLLQLPAGKVQLAIGAGHREESNETFNRVIQATTRNADRDVESAFAEINVPLFSVDNRRTLLEELTFSAALRNERYSDVGDTTDPKFGLRWRPLESLLLRATAGESFRAPTLPTVDTGAQAVIFPLADPQAPPDTFTTSLVLLGVDPDVGPETADSWTFGFDFQPKFLPGGQLSLTWFDTDYTDRIQAPATTFVTFLIDEASLADFIVRNPSPTQVSDTIAVADEFFNPFGIPESEVAAIVNDQTQNLASVEASGFELDASYGFDALHGRLTGKLSGQYLAKFEQQALSSSPVIDLVDTLFNPPRLRTLASLTWSNERAVLAATVNHTDGYRNTAIFPTGSIDSSTTFDLHSSYTFAGLSRSFFEELQLAVTVLDLFDSGPPRAAGTLAGYDAHNANPYGRVVSAQIRMHW